MVWLARSTACQRGAGICKMSSGEVERAIQALISKCCSWVSKSRCSISSMVFIWGKAVIHTGAHERAPEASWTNISPRKSRQNMVSYRSLDCSVVIHQRDGQGRTRSGSGLRCGRLRDAAGFRFFPLPAKRAALRRDGKKQPDHYRIDSYLNPKTGFRRLIRLRYCKQHRGCVSTGAAQWLRRLHHSCSIKLIAA